MRRRSRGCSTYSHPRQRMSNRDGGTGEQNGHDLVDVRRRRGGGASSGPVEPVPPRLLLLPRSVFFAAAAAVVVVVGSTVTLPV